LKTVNRVMVNRHLWGSWRPARGGYRSWNTLGRYSRWLAMPGLRRHQDRFRNDRDL